MGDLSGFLPQWQGDLRQFLPQFQGVGPQQLGANPAPQYAPQLGPPQPNPGPQYAPRIGLDAQTPVGPQYAPRLGPDAAAPNPVAGLDLTRAVGIPFLPHGTQVGAVGTVNPTAHPGPLLHPELVALLSQILRRFNSRPQIKHRRPAD